MKRSHFKLALGTALLSCCGYLMGCVSGPPELSAIQTVDLQREAVEYLKRGIQYEANPVVRIEAVQGFESWGHEDGYPWIRSALIDQSPGVRFAATVAVGLLGDELARDAVSGLLRDPDPSVRAAAMFALHRLGDQSLTGRLATFLVSHEDPLVRRNAAMVIGFLDEPGVVPMLAGAMDDRDVGVQNQALESMARYGNEEARQRLVFMANSGVGSEEVIGIAALSEARNEALRDLFAYKLGDNDAPYVETRLAAAYGLALLGEHAGFDLALQWVPSRRVSITDSEDSAEGRSVRIRQLSMAVLGAIGDPAALAVLREAMTSDRDARIQVAAAKAILEIIGGQDQEELPFEVPQPDVS